MAETIKEMIEKAREMVFDSGYQDAKALIRSHLDHFTDEVLMSMSDRQKQNEADLDTDISLHRLCDPYGRRRICSHHAGNAKG